ncbi:MAG: membrane protein insertase YidC, partial [Hyphomicrobiales bacterium]
MEQNNTNFLLAIILSLAVLVAWQYYFVPENKPAHQAEQQQQQQQQGQQAQPGSSIPSPDAGAPGAPRPSAASAPTTGPVHVVGREQAIKAGPRVAISTPSLTGSIALKGGRIDDLVLKKYRVSVKPESENVVLFSPAGTVAPYYAEYGWVAGPGQSMPVPDADTVWTQQGGN